MFAPAALSLICFVIQPTGSYYHYSVQWLGRNKMDSLALLRIIICHTRYIVISRETWLLQEVGITSAGRGCRQWCWWWWSHGLPPGIRCVKKSIASGHGHWRCICRLGIAGRDLLWPGKWQLWRKHERHLHRLDPSCILAACDKSARKTTKLHRKFASIATWQS